MAKNKKRKKAIDKAKRQREGQAKFLANAKATSIQKLRKFVREHVAVQQHIENTTPSVQAGEIYNKLYGGEEE